MLFYSFVLQCLCLTSHQQLRSYGDGPRLKSLIWQTGEAGIRTCDPWYIRRGVYPLQHGGSFHLFWIFTSHSTIIFFSNVQKISCLPRLKQSMNVIFIMLINVKMPTIFNIYDHDKFYAQLSWAWKKFYNLGASTIKAADKVSCSRTQYSDSESLPTEPLRTLRSLKSLGLEPRYLVCSIT